MGYQLQTENMPEPIKWVDAGTEEARKAKRRERDRAMRQRKREEAEAAGEPIRKRGRPRKDEQGANPAPKAKAAPKEADGGLEAELDAMRKEHASDPAQPAQAMPESEGPPLITGYLLLIVIDAMAPGLVVLSVKWATGRTDIAAETLRLGESDRKAVEPLADEAAKVIMARMNPVAMFGLVMVAMYAMRIPPEKPEAKAKRLAERKAAKARKKMRVQ